jgi:poly(3-hydroxybutyrate) depolymerase
MPTQIGVRFTSAHSAGGHRRARLAAVVAAIATALAITGCNPAATQSSVRDPADPAARVAGVGYRSTVAPYTSLRPAPPGPWRERNDSVAPQPGSGRVPQ